MDPHYPATNYLDEVKMQERSSGPFIEVVIQGRHLDLDAPCGACVGVKQEGQGHGHTRVPGQCSKAEVSWAFADAAGETASSRVVKQEKQEEGQGHTRVAGKCSKAQVSLAIADAAGESASSQRGGAAPAQLSASDSTALQDSEPQLPLALPASGGAAPPELEGSLALPANSSAAATQLEPSDTSRSQQTEPRLPLARRLRGAMSNPEHRRHQPLNSRALRRVASDGDGDALEAPEQAQVSSMENYSANQLMAYFRQHVAKKPGPFLFKDVFNNAPVPLGAMTMPAIWKGWARSFKLLKKNRQIAINKGKDLQVGGAQAMPDWKVDVLVPGL